MARDGQLFGCSHSGKSLTLAHFFPYVTLPLYLYVSPHSVYLHSPHSSPYITLPFFLYITRFFFADGAPSQWKGTRHERRRGGRSTGGASRDGQRGHACLPCLLKMGVCVCVATLASAPPHLERRQTEDLRPQKPQDRLPRH